VCISIFIQVCAFLYSYKYTYLSANVRLFTVCAFLYSYKCVHFYIHTSIRTSQQMLDSSQCVHFYIHTSVCISIFIQVYVPLSECKTLHREGCWQTEGILIHQYHIKQSPYMCIFVSGLRDVTYIIMYHIHNGLRWRAQHAHRLLASYQDASTMRNRE